MNIGIDVVGVLVNVQSYQLKYGKRYFCEIYYNRAGTYNGRGKFICTHGIKLRYTAFRQQGRDFKRPLFSRLLYNRHVIPAS